MNFKNHFKSLKKTFQTLTIAGASLGAQAQSTVVTDGVQRDVNNISALAPLLRTDKDIGNVRVGV